MKFTIVATHKNKAKEFFNYNGITLKTAQRNAKWIKVQNPNSAVSLRVKK